MELSRLAEALGLDDNDVRELLDLFLETCRSDICKLADAVKDDDCEKARRAAHSIKGASGNMRFTEIYEMAKTAEDESRQNRLENIPNTVDRIKEELNELKEYLKSIQ